MVNNLGLVLVIMKMKPTELARKLYVQPSTINNYIQGIRTPDVYTALKIARVLGVKVEDIWEDRI